MSNIKISELDEADLPLDGTEDVVMVQDGVTVRASTQDIADLAVTEKTYRASAVAVLTGAPSVTSKKNTTGATITWARTGTGTYTLTANSAIFTSGKTEILINGFGDAIPKFVNRNYTSTTVITLYVQKMEDLSLDDGFDIDVAITIYP